MDTNSIERHLKNLNKVFVTNSVEDIINELNLNILDVAKKLETRVFEFFRDYEDREYTSQIAEYKDLKYTISIKLYENPQNLKSYFTYYIVLNSTQTIFIRSLPIRGLSKISKDIVRLIVKDIINRKW